MNELAKLQALYQRRGINLGQGDEGERLRRCAAFTRAAAWELRETGWGNIRKTGGVQVNGLDVDKLFNRDTREVVDIIIASGGDAPRVAWQQTEAGTDIERWISPAPPDDEVIPEPQPEPQPEPAPPAPLRIDAEDVRTALHGLMAWHGHSGQELPSNAELIGRAVDIATAMAERRERG